MQYFTYVATIVLLSVVACERRHNPYLGLYERRIAETLLIFNNNEVRLTVESEFWIVEKFVASTDCGFSWEQLSGFEERRIIHAPQVEIVTFDKLKNDPTLTYYIVKTNSDVIIVRLVDNVFGQGFWLTDCTGQYGPFAYGPMFVQILKAVDPLCQRNYKCIQHVYDFYSSPDNIVVNSTGKIEDATTTVAATTTEEAIDIVEQTTPIVNNGVRDDEHDDGRERSVDNHGPRVRRFAKFSNGPVQDDSQSGANAAESRGSPGSPVGQSNFRSSLYIDPLSIC